MSSGWGAIRGGDHSVPVEMRFIDMFMAALGALIFMAMLLAFLIQFLPHQGQIKTTGSAESHRSETISLLTKSLPAAQAGEPYEVALAYRGGTGSVSWEVVAGAQEIPKGLIFDQRSGILTGTPAGPKVSRFVLRVRDSSNGTDERPYELTVLPSRKASKGYERWVAGAFMALAIIIWMAVVFSSMQLKLQVAHLQEAYREGKLSVEYQTGFGVKETVDLPDGIYTKHAMLSGAQRFGRYWLIGTLILCAILIWRYWFS